MHFNFTGLRNALINNFSQIQIRNDRGALFENFMITEIMKLNFYGNYGYKLNYWRLRQKIFIKS
ncbi:hypothetical protein CO050_03335 [Candidatus Roizmanbacteria bacterium CG_4_9_14_0_2_um_filter_38_17]|nr:MAG: hypothetical protein CO050_03335 [Candidatus Roizmanbacteria bacterium CG_4_9_14_0_2_um_filter_38_17]